MKGEKRIWLVALFLFAFLPLASASYSIEIITVQENILPGEAARFELYITNELEVPDRYVINSEQFNYLLSFDPRPGDVAPGEVGMFGLEITPRSGVNFGTYRVPIRIRSQTSGAVQEINPIIRLQDPERQGAVYTPSIALGVDMPSVVDPRDDIVLRLNLRNRNARVYDSQDPLTMVIDGELFFRQYPQQLGGVNADGERATEQRFSIDPFQPPGEHELLVEVRVGNRTVSSQTAQYTVSAYIDIVEESVTEGRFFRHTTTFTVTNQGNIADEASVAYPSSALQRLFFSASDDFTVETIDGEQYAVISTVLRPQESATITVTENYRILALLVFLAFLSVIGYFLLRSPVVLGKEASLAGTPDDGVSEIKVRLFIKNRTSKTMRNLRVIDRISGMADVVKEDSLGTLKPTKISKKKGQGTLVRWDVDQIEPFEERIISYRAKTPLKLVGDVTLPAVKVKYDLPSGRERTSHSNEVLMAKGE